MSIMSSKVFTEKQFHQTADMLLDLSKKLQEEYWELSKKLETSSYVTFIEQMEDAQRLGKLAQAIREIQGANGTLRHVTCNI